MSDHSLALVPIESWAYSSPGLLRSGRSVDVGLLAESLIYYDRIIFNVSNQPQLAETIRWFWDRHCYPDFLSLLNDGTLQFCEYSFASAAVLDQSSSRYILLNIQDREQEKPGTFENRFLYHPIVQNCLPHSRMREQLFKAFRGKVIEEKASDFGNAVDNAISDFRDPERVALIVQALIDEVWEEQSLGKPPMIKVGVVESADKSMKITYNIDFKQFSKNLGPKLNFGEATPLTAAVQCNRFLWSSAKLGCDLYMPNPMGVLIGDKLCESGKTLIRTHSIVETLQTKVEFPDIRQLVNEGKLTFQEVLNIREKAVKFRNWLQTEGDRDRDAIIAYHNELGKELGITRGLRKTLNLFGVFGGPTLGVIVATKTGDIAGVGLGAGVTYLSDLASKIGSNWRPVVFGNWLKERVSKIIGTQN